MPTPKEHKLQEFYKKATFPFWSQKSDLCLFNVAWGVKNDERICDR
jgi:hypothetical protein